MYEAEVAVVLTLLGAILPLYLEIQKLAKKLERIEERTLWLEKYIRNHGSYNHGR